MEFKEAGTPCYPITPRPTRSSYVRCVAYGVRRHQPSASVYNKRRLCLRVETGFNKSKHSVYLLLLFSSLT